ncbi:MAG: transposase [Patescibacteria group bacterium]
MPRGPRISYEQAFYHVYNRGVARQPIFQDANDYQKFLKRLVELKTKKGFDHSIYAYVLMPNHFHLLIQTRKIPISKIMTSLTTSYSMYFNKVYHRVGPLFQNRFKSKLCDKDAYFLGASRYILLNPIEAGLAKSLEDYLWSSYQELFGELDVTIIDRDEVSRLIGTTQKEKDGYRSFLLDGIKSLKEISNDYTLDREIEGSPLFQSLSQKKYLRRKYTGR